MANKQNYENHEARVIKTNRYLISVQTDSLYKSKRYPLRTYADDKDDSVSNRKSVFVFRLTDYSNKGQTKTVTFSLSPENVKRFYTIASGYPLPFKREGQYYGRADSEHGNKHAAYYWDISRQLKDQNGKARTRDIIINCKNGYCNVKTEADGRTKMIDLTDTVAVNITLTNDEWFYILNSCMEALTAKETIWAMENTLGVFSAWIEKKFKSLADLLEKRFRSITDLLRL